MVNPDVWKSLRISKGNVKIVGSNAWTWKRLSFVVLVFAGTACTQAPVKEFFCESTDPKGGIHFYKQQVVQLSNQQMCVLWPMDTPVCVQANKPLKTAWQDNPELQTKHQETLELRLSKESAVLQISQSQQSINATSANEIPVSPLVRFEFKKRAEVLMVYTSAVDKDAREFACQPWAKRAWWQWI
jgi:hypothetical protein